MSEPRLVTFTDEQLVFLRAFADAGLAEVARQQAEIEAKALAAIDALREKP